MNDSWGVLSQINDCDKGASDVSLMHPEQLMIQSKLTKDRGYMYHEEDQI